MSDILSISKSNFETLITDGEVTINGTRFYLKEGVGIETVRKIAQQTVDCHQKEHTFIGNRYTVDGFHQNSDGIELDETVLEALINKGIIVKGQLAAKLDEIGYKIMVNLCDDILKS